MLLDEFGHESRNTWMCYLYLSTFFARVVLVGRIKGIFKSVEPYSSGQSREYHKSLLPLI